MSIAYSIAIDSGLDGKFASEISSQVVEMRWRLGMKRAHDSMAETSWARITVDNRGGRFSPERQALAIGARVRIQSRHKGATRTHFIGAVSHIEPDAGDWSDGLARIHLQDVQAELENNPARLPPQIDATADKVIAALLDQAALRPPIIAGYCIINVAGYSMIDSVKIFADLQPAQRLQKGKTRFAYVGDWWRDTTTIRQAISDLAASERGRFYINRAGEAVFLNRHHTLTHDTVAAHFDNSMSGLDYSYGDQRLNCLALRLRPRRIGNSDDLLWRLDSALRIDARSELNLTLRLLDEREQPVGLLGVDKLVSRFRAPAGWQRVDIAQEVSAEIAHVEASSAVARIVNRRRHAVELVDLRLYGKALYRGDPIEIVAEDGEGIYLYGLKPLALDLPALSDIVTAQAFVSYELARRKSPRGTVSSMRLIAGERPDDALELSLFDRIRISESQTGQSQRDYFIIGEEHRLGAGGKRHEVLWTLEEADATSFVIVNDSRIDGVDLLAPH